MRCSQIYGNTWEMSLAAELAMQAERFRFRHAARPDRYFAAVGSLPATA